MDPNVRCSKRMLNVITHSLTLVSALSKSRELHLTSIQVPMFMSHLHQGHISPRFTPVAMVPFHTLSGLTSIWVTSHLHQGHENCIRQVLSHPIHVSRYASPSRSRFTRIQVSWFPSHPIFVASHLHPLSPSSRFTQSRYQDWRLSSTHVTSRLHPGP